MSWKRLADIFARRLENVLKTFLQDVLKTVWRPLENVLARRLEDVLKTPWRYFCKTSWRCLRDILKTYDQDEYIGLNQDVLKTFSEDVWVRQIYLSRSRRLEEVLWIRRRKTCSRSLQDVFFKTNVCWYQCILK